MQAVADIIGCDESGKATARGLTDAIGAAVEHEGTALIAFHKRCTA